MTRLTFPLVGALGLLAASAPPPLAAQGPVEGPVPVATPMVPGAERWWRHVEMLAHDSMRGRQTGSPEHREAAEYVAARFRELGLRPAGSDGYFQPVRFVVRTWSDEGSAAALIAPDGAVDSLVIGRDVLLSHGAPLAPALEAPLAFAGYGMRLPEAGYDDLGGRDLRGKIAVVLVAQPQGLDGPAYAHARRGSWPALRAAGAIGVVSIPVATGNDVPFPRAAMARFLPAMVLADAGADGPRVAGSMNLQEAARLFAGSGADWETLRALAERGAPLPPVTLARSFRQRASVRTAEVVSDNVAALLPGRDPALADQVVVLSAHLDHVGVGRALAGDSIFNGAMDNASGTAALLEVARLLAERSAPLGRSILFLAVTGEEKGLLGSDWFARHPTIDRRRLVANLNTDMFLPLQPLTYLLVNGLEESDLADDVRRAGARMGVEVVTDPEPERVAFVRSDQYSFIREGIPALSLKVGFLRGTPGHELVKRWRTERYHGVADDLTQPIDFRSAADFLQLYALTVVEVANRASVPAWHPSSVFGRRAATP